jgi:hypothetical protein
VCFGAQVPQMDGHVSCHQHRSPQVSSNRRSSSQPGKAVIKGGGELERGRVSEWCQLSMSINIG